MFRATYFELLYSVQQRHISHQTNVSIPVVWSSNVIYWNVVYINNKNFNDSILLFHFTASLLNSNNSNNLCSSDKMSVIVSWQEQFDAPENFSHSATHTLQALGCHPHSARVAHAPTAHKCTTHSCIHFPNWIALYRTSGLPAGNNYRTPPPPSLASLRPQSV